MKRPRRDASSRYCRHIRAAADCNTTTNSRDDDDDDDSCGIMQTALGRSRVVGFVSLANLIACLAERLPMQNSLVVMAATCITSSLLSSAKGLSVSWGPLSKCK